MKKRIDLFVVTTILFFSFVSLVSANEIIELRYAGWAWEEDGQVQQVRIDAFNEAHPNIHVTYEFIPHGEYDSRIMALAAAGDLPDVLWVNNNLLYVRNGWLADITSFLEADPTFDEDLILGNA